MTLKRYDEFLLESVIRTSKEFIKILEIIKDESKAATKLLDLLGKDIKTNYNFIKISDDPSKLSFVPDTQVARRLAAGSSEEDLFASASNPTSIGRLVRSIFAANNVPVSDAELFRLGAMFLSLAQMRKEQDSFQMVEGEEVRKWYHHSTYAGREGRDGTLNKSCMRHDDSQDYLDIYTQNPDVVSMIIKLDENGKLQGRALLWETDKGPYLDRVYSIRPDIAGAIELWAEMTNEGLLKFSKIGSERLHVQLSRHAMYRAYPYVDSLCYYIRKGGPDEVVPATLQNYEKKDSGGAQVYYLHDTDGGWERVDEVYSDYLDVHINRSDAIYSSHLESWIREDDSEQSSYHGGYIPRSHAVWSEVCQSWIMREDAVEVVVSEDGEVDHYPDGSRKYPYVTDYLTNTKFSPKIAQRVLVEWEGKMYDMRRAVFVVMMDEQGIKAYEDVYGTRSEACTMLDAKLFGFGTIDEQFPTDKDRLVRNQYKATEYPKMVAMVQALDAPAALKREKLREMAESHEFMMGDDAAYRARHQGGKPAGGPEL